jgi:hypothetical protein
LTDVALPVVWRPRTTRVVGYGLAGAIVLGMIALAFVLPPSWGVADRIGMVCFGLLVAWILHRLARCRVVADDGGLTVVNAIGVQRYEWAQVLRATMGVGDPWPRLDLADGESVSAMGINGAERELAARQLAELRSLLSERAEAPDRLS